VSKKMRIVLAIVLGAVCQLMGLTFGIFYFVGVDIESVWNGTLFWLLFFIVIACYFIACYHLIRSGILPKIVRNILIYQEFLIVLMAVLGFASLIYYA